jgi:hypothetical protein
MTTLNLKSSKPKTFKKKFPVRIFIVGFLIVTGLILCSGAYYSYRQHEKNISVSSASIEKEIGSLADLPTDEQPTVATVTNKEKIKDQAFFANAENGDKILIYNKAKKIFLYRPSTKEIIKSSVFPVAK